jgi:hypothetical protein
MAITTCNFFKLKLKIKNLKEQLKKKVMKNQELHFRIIKRKYC